MFPDVPEISGKKLVPQLGIGCFLFTLIGLVATYWIATAVTNHMRSNPSSNSPYSREQRA
jgi:hypothetical protein